MRKFIGTVILISWLLKVLEFIGAVLTSPKLIKTMSAIVDDLLADVTPGVVTKPTPMKSADRTS